MQPINPVEAAAIFLDTLVHHSNCLVFQAEQMSNSVFLTILMGDSLAVCAELMLAEVDIVLRCQEQVSSGRGQTGDKV